MEIADKIIDVIPPKYRSLAIAIAVISPYVTRGACALMHGRGLKGVISAIWLGTNTPKPVVPAEDKNSPNQPISQHENDTHT